MASEEHADRGKQLRYERTSRRANFTKTLESQQDVEALGDRIAQPIGVGLRRRETDGVTVKIIEQTAEGSEGFKSRFGAPLNSERDVESVLQRIVNTVGVGFDRGEVKEVEVKIIECRRVTNDE